MGCFAVRYTYLYAHTMAVTDNKFMQIAFSFDDVAPEPIQESIQEPVPEPVAELPVVEETAPVNVGVRIKALKEAIPVKSAPTVLVRTKSTRGRKPLKSMDTEAALVNIPEDETLFQKQYYSIGEVADMFSVNTSLIRFWANEFAMVQPRTNRKGDRHFRPVDIKNLLLIHDLLRRRKLTIEGAKDFLKKNKKAQERYEMIESLRKIKNFFLEVKATL